MQFGVYYLWLVANLTNYYFSVLHFLDWSSFEHDIVEVDEKADENGLVSSSKSATPNGGDTVWNAKV